MFYDKFVKLCVSIDKKPSAVAKEIGINKSTVTNWKNRGTTPTDAIVQKVADYFSIPVSDLSEEKENTANQTVDGLNQDYFLLSDENKAFIDEMIVKLLKSQSPD